MKPQFSILALLTITAYVGVNVAAFAYPQSIWSLGAFGYWLAIMIWCATIAAGKDAPATAFCRGFALSCFAGVVACVFSGLYNLAVLISRDDSSFGTYQEYLNYTLRARWLLANFSLAIGLLGGCLALWRYRVLERQEKEATA